jgi:hypothetical protein
MEGEGQLVIRRALLFLALFLVVVCAGLSAQDTSGPQKTLVLLFHLSDEGPGPATTGEVATIMSGVDQFYQADSYGAVSIKASVTDWLTIPVTHSSLCDPVNWTQMIYDAAMAQGWSPARYARKVFIMARNSGCSWDGYTVVGDTLAYFNGIPYVGSVAHEFGHDFGLWHSHGESCNSAGCTIDEYGDIYSVMGSGLNPISHTTAFEKERLGWLGYTGRRKILKVTASGVYSLSPLEDPSGGVKALLWREPGFYDPRIGSDGGRGYYVELRVGVGVLIHTGGQCLNATCFQRKDDSLLKDLDSGDPVVRVLGVGQTYSASGVSITPLAVSDLGASVQIGTP